MRWEALDGWEFRCSPNIPVMSCPIKKRQVHTSDAVANGNIRKNTCELHNANASARPRNGELSIFLHLGCPCICSCFTCEHCLCKCKRKQVKLDMFAILEKDELRLRISHSLRLRGGGGGALPYKGLTGTCGPTGMVFRIFVLNGCLFRDSLGQLDTNQENRQRLFYDDLVPYLCDGRRSFPTYKILQHLPRVQVSHNKLKVTSDALFLYGEAPPRGPTPYPFIYHFFQKRHPFHIPNYCSLICNHSLARLMNKSLKQEVFLSFFSRSA